MKEGCAIPLFSGIGNVIQSLPFAFEMKKRYKRVVAFLRNMDFPETKHLIVDIFDEIYFSRNKVPSNYKFFKIPKRRSFSEYKSWFVDNNEPMPKEFKIDFIGHEKIKKKHKIVIWPECKNNWPCKKWPYWNKLISKLDDVAIVGLYKNDDLIGGTDYRGKLSLQKTGGLISNSDIFIGNEGGISHYAAALDVKTYIIFGCSDIIKNVPPNNVIPITRNLSCQPCQFKNILRRGKVFLGCNHRKCLKKLKVKDVLEAIK